MDHPINGSSFGFLAIQVDSTKDLRSPSQVINDQNTIESDFEILSYEGLCEEHGVVFSLLKKEYNQTLKFAFDIRYWPAY